MYHFKKMSLVAMCLTLFCGNANAITYTAVLSGNFNSALTWGGILPGSLLPSDIVVIPAGINVTLTTVQTLSGTTSMTVNGTLSSATGGALVMTGGTLAGSGVINVDSAALDLASGFTFTGDLTANRLSTAGLNVSSAADIMVNNALYLTSGTMAMTAGSLTMGNNSLIVRSGGALTSGGSAALNLTNTYGVTYLTSAATSGAELTGSGLTNVTVNNASTVTLGAATTLNGMLSLTSGNLQLNGQTLTFGNMGNLSASGTGSIAGTAASNIVVNSTAGLTGALRFASGSNTINNLTINTSSASGTMLGSDLNVNGILTLSSGAMSLNGNTLTFNAGGNLSGSGSGTITGSSTSDIIVNATAGLTGMLRLTTGGNTLNNLTINTGSGNNVTLGTDVVTNGTLTLTAGNLVLNGYTLAFGATGNMAAAGSGVITGSNTSNIIVNATAGLTGALRFATGSNMLNNLTINSGSGSSTMLGGDLTLNGMLTLTSGSLSLNGNDLTFGATGNTSASGTGTIMGNAGSNIIVNATSGLTGAIRFATGANTINDLTINTGSGGNVSLGSNVNVNGTLTLTNGTLTLNGRSLTFGTTGNLAASGSGTITGDNMGEIVVNATSGLSGMLNFTSGSNMLGNLSVNTSSASGVTLGDDVTINGILTLNAGSLTLNGNTLTFGSGGNLAATGSGMLAGSATSNIIVNSTAGLTGAINFSGSGNVLHNLTVNTGAGNGITLGDDLTLNGTLALQSGTVRLGANDLMISAGGNVTGGSSTSYVMTNGTGQLMMNLAAGANSTFHVGTTSNYAPMKIAANAGATTGNVGINAAYDVLTGGTTGSSMLTTDALVNTTWHVNSTASTVNYDMTAMWSSAMEVNGFDRTHAYISHYTSGAWDTYAEGVATASGSMYAMTRTGITSLSPFAVRSNTPVSTQNVAAAQQFITLYPNPVVNVLHISGTAITTANIYDMTGKLVVSRNVANNEINISDLAAGNYVVQLAGESVTATQQFVKQ